nr:zinc finger, CCHC-type [Tanacetum cinerariifolium]
MVAKGFTQKEGPDYFNTYTPVERTTTIRILIALATINKLIIHQMDVNTNFLNGELEEQVYLEQPEGSKLTYNTGRILAQNKYAKVIGSLTYVMTCTRPDIVYVVGRLCRHTSSPGKEHWDAVNRVFKYLKKTIDYALEYNEYPSILEGFDLNKEDVVPNVEEVSLVDGVFDGAFGRDREKEVVMREGVLVTSSLLEMLTKSCLGGMMVSLIFIEGLEEEA